VNSDIAMLALRLSKLLQHSHDWTYLSWMGVDGDAERKKFIETVRTLPQDNKQFRTGQLLDSIATRFINTALSNRVSYYDIDDAIKRLAPRR